MGGWRGNKPPHAGHVGWLISHPGSGHHQLGTPSTHSTPLKLYPLSRVYLHIYISTYLAHDTRLLLLSYPRCWHQLVATPRPPPPTPTITPIVVGAVWGDATHITTHSTTSWRWYMVLLWDLDIQGVYKRTGISRIRDVLEWCQSVNVLFRLVIKNLWKFIKNLTALWHDIGRMKPEKEITILSDWFALYCTAIFMNILCIG